MPPSPIAIRRCYCGAPLPKGRTRYCSDLHYRAAQAFHDRLGGNVYLRQAKWVLDHPDSSTPAQTKWAQKVVDGVQRGERTKVIHRQSKFYSLLEEAGLLSDLPEGVVVIDGPVRGSPNPKSGGAAPRDPEGEAVA